METDIATRLSRFPVRCKVPREIAIAKSIVDNVLVWNEPIRIDNTGGFDMR
jgi:hypothetical protein